MDKGRSLAELKPSREPEWPQCAVEIDRPEGLARQVRPQACRKVIGALADLLEPAFPRRPRREVSQGPGGRQKPPRLEPLEAARREQLAQLVALEAFEAHGLHVLEERSGLVEADSQPAGKEVAGRVCVEPGEGVDVDGPPCRLRLGEARVDEGPFLPGAGYSRGGCRGILDGVAE